MGKSRIKTITRDKLSSDWVTQNAPIEIQAKSNKFRLRNNMNEIVFSQTISVNQDMKKVRLKIKGESVTSESL